MKKIYYVVLFLACTAITLEALVIYLSNQKAGDSIGVSEMKQEIAVIEEENRHLKREVLQFASLKNIASKAAEIGFVQESKYITLDGNDTIAAR